ncbi:GNAT family N-acetyltransferase [Bradyrhizobium sp.]|uniref:GNAT family N-acetyltransferase n=1 Tax=Bradyrhizobium sp. TaxID=376 RepID=UPI0025BFDB34|nr:GNAT family N-acetyltransferase [Bradyrhizobium sp.]
MNFQIAAFHDSHRSQVLELSLRAWAPVFEKFKPAVQAYVYDAFYPQGWRVRQTSDIEQFLKAEAGQVWVAIQADSVLGWVGIRVHPEDKMGEIYILAVDPNHQRRGIARALMDHAMAQMRQTGMKIVMVETGDDPGHAPSRATYERAGFERWPVARYFRQL